MPKRRPGRKDSRVAAVGNFFVPQAAAATVSQRSSNYAAPAIAELPVPRGGWTKAQEERAVKGVNALSRSPLPPKKPLDKMKLAQTSTNWTAEVGPYSSESQALVDLAGIANRPLVGRVVPKFRVSRSVGRVGKQIFKLRMSGLSQGRASQICGELLQRSIICRVVPTN